MQVGGGDGPRDAVGEQAPGRGPDRHERALVTQPRGIPCHRRDRTPADQSHTVSTLKHNFSTH